MGDLLKRSDLIAFTHLTEGQENAVLYICLHVYSFAKIM